MGPGASLEKMEPSEELVTARELLDFCGPTPTNMGGGGMAGGICGGGGGGGGGGGTGEGLVM